MITTIQIDDGVKKALNRFKKNGKETYEQVIVNIIKEIEKQKRGRKELLIEGYKKMAKESLRVSMEWEGTLMDGLDKNEKWDL